MFNVNWEGFATTAEKEAYRLKRPMSIRGGFNRMGRKGKIATVGLSAGATGYLMGRSSGGRSNNNMNGPM